MMKQLMVLVLATVISCSFAGEEWTPLFNGKDFQGWTFDTLDKAAPETIWSVTNGVINVAGKKKPNGVIRTEKVYSNYELEFEWRWPDSGGNSGCLIHTSDPRLMGVWPKSVEVQLMKDNAGDFWQIGERVEVHPDQIVTGKNGKVSRRRLNLTDGSEKPMGEWNKMRVVAKGKTVEVYVNGILVNKGWAMSVTEGSICLQAERANVQFRNIRIKH
jgi:hypothetical protein